MLWRIEGFSSDDPVPGPLDAPTPTDMAKQTRSYFAPTPSLARPAMFTRLAQFHTPDCGVQFFMRFRVFRAPGRHPVLAFANAKSRTFFWDLARFPSYSRYMADLREAQKAGRPLVENGVPAVPKPAWLMAKRGKKTARAAEHAVFCRRQRRGQGVDGLGQPGPGGRHGVGPRPRDAAGVGRHVRLVESGGLCQGASDAAD